MPLITYFNKRKKCYFIHKRLIIFAVWWNTSSTNLLMFDSKPIQIIFLERIFFPNSWHEFFINNKTYRWHSAKIANPSLAFGCNSRTPMEAKISPNSNKGNYTQLFDWLILKITDKKDIYHMDMIIRYWRFPISNTGLDLLEIPRFLLIPYFEGI